MLPGLEMMACPEMAVSMDVMQHVINVESSRNPYAIGVVGGALVRQPKQLDEALATVRMLEEKGYNFSVGLAQVNRYNLVKYGLDSYEKAFQQCPNLQAASRILAECYGRSGNDWGKSFSCYYSGNFTTGFRHGYVQKVFASIARQRGSMVAANGAVPIDVVSRAERRVVDVAHHPQLSGQPQDVVALRTADAALSRVVMGAVERAMPQPPAPAAAPEPIALPPVPAQPMAQNTAGPVVVRPWSERNAPVALPTQAPPAQAMPVQNVPAGDAAFVF
ncbi:MULTISPECIES: lytic transglycosylase domain-containing protein [Stenotrophomonas]|uniref:lytic transglycosylase domain-containing protein n=1 Tax=Stenotrophomonas TaxID=40323 RepID=UPI000873435C|nr:MULTISPECIES: lytic transglycosylase domain-containing protein [Stenotrophomonas]OEZ02396.1 type VI secretion protein [Stenotrophomonas sp. BIIR7]